MYGLKPVLFMVDVHVEACTLQTDPSPQGVSAGPAFAPRSILTARCENEQSMVETAGNYPSLDDCGGAGGCGSGLADPAL